MLFKLLRRLCNRIKVKLTKAFDPERHFKFLRRLERCLARIKCEFTRDVKVEEFEEQNKAIFNDVMVS